MLRTAVGIAVVGVVAAAIAIVGALRGGGRTPTVPDPPANAPAAPAPATGYSNIYASDYVGPERCGECHRENFESWAASLHAAMNRRAADPGAVWGDFADATLAYGGGTATFTREDGVPVMALAPAGGPARRFRVTRTIGARYLQEYVGVQVQGPEPGDHALYRTEIRLPFGSWRRAGGWVPRSYYDSWYPPEYAADGALAEDPYRPDDEPWATRCVWCHNTYPFELRAIRALDRDLGNGLEQYVSLAVARRDAASRGAVAERNLLPLGELVTVGISCESCHLGGREHAEHEDDVSFVPRSGDLRPRPGVPALDGGRDDPVVVDAICAQCHSTPSPRWPNRAAQRNSTEALDLLAGACVPSIKCTDCHDPHVAGPGAGAPDQAQHLAACTTCHPAFADAPARRAHSRHGDADASCLDCHMPRIVQGLSAMVRSHRISSPSDAEMLALEAPNACNLCHLDRSLTWTAQQLEEGWGRRTDVADGDPDADDADELGRLWLASDRGALRITAAAAYARSPLGRAALPALLSVLDQPKAYDRMWILFAVEDVLCRRLSRAQYDPLAAPAVRAAQALRLRAVPPAP